MKTLNVLLIGASGRLGLQIIRAAATCPSNLRMHAFVRTFYKIPTDDAALCASVIRGNALSPNDIRHALSQTHADVVLMSIAVRNSIARTDLRFRSARALMDVIHTGSAYDHVRVLCVSSTGAGSTRVDFKMGMGTALAFMLRYVMRDHGNQEAVFQSRLEAQKDRLLIIRPTALTEGKASGKTVTFDPMTRAPSSKIDRADLAEWIVKELCGGMKHFGMEINITREK